MSNANSKTSEAMLRAIELFKAGKSVEAEEVVQAAALETEKRFGAHHPETASIYSELGTILLNAENRKGAVEAFRRACAGPMPKEPQALRDRLTYMMNLGMALQEAKELEEAEHVLREGCEARKAYYGAEHAGYAFGPEPLGELLLRRGKLDEALEVLDEAVANFWNNGHQRVATAVALQAEALKRAGRTERPFEGLEPLPDDVIQGIANHLFERTREADPAIMSAVLRELLPVLKQRFGPDHALVTNTLIHVANLEAMCGAECDFQVRLQVTREVLETFDRQGRTKEAVQTLQGLALAYAEAGRHEPAIEQYRQAVERAERSRDAALSSQVHRNFGLLLAELDRDAEAEAELTQAHRAAERCGEQEMLGRAGIALGIFYQHRERFSEARPLLEAALQRLNPAHPDAVTGRSHLQAVEAGRPCGCGNQGEALAAAFREFVLSRLPQDLLEHLEVRLEDNDFKIQVRLNREPAKAELEHLDRVINHALGEFRRRIRRA
jgi:tetratricopeptide (TPR) repeat protein